MEAVRGKLVYSHSHCVSAAYLTHSRVAVYLAGAVHDDCGIHIVVANVEVEVEVEGRQIDG